MTATLIMGWSHNQWVHAITHFRIKTGKDIDPSVAGLIALKDWWADQFGLYPPTGEVSSQDGGDWVRAATFALKVKVGDFLS